MIIRLFLGMMLYGIGSFLWATEKPMTIHHKLAVTVQLEASQIVVQDNMTLPSSWSKPYLDVALNPNFSVRYQAQVLKPIQKTSAYSSYRLKRQPTQKTVQIQYQGTLSSTPDCQWLTQACVMLNQTGVYLDGRSYWYPNTLDMQKTFELQLTGLPEAWTSLSQGMQIEQGWRIEKPQRQLYLIAAPFSVYEKDVKSLAKIQVLLRHDDPELAQRYLDKSEVYLKRYSKLLGQYPYRKFVTVESFWESGWGMPSFTLLGSKVMRLPFIPDTSLPHEIVHNWWGNGVYVDASQGNWSEGLTAYLADHYQKKLKQEDRNYRRDTLQKIALFSQQEKLLLREFRSRHNRATQAIGYGKSMMLFHAVAKQIGDETFYQALRLFFSRYQFKQASFPDLQTVFNEVSQQDLSPLFEAYLNRTDTPKLQLGTVFQRDNKTAEGEQKELVFELSQIQEGDAFELHIPVALYKNETDEPSYEVVHMTEKQQQFVLHVKHPIKAIMVDPDFDVLREPDMAELPPSLDILFSRQPKHFVMARGINEAMQVAWEELAETLNFGKEPTLQFDDQPLPDSAKTLVLFGGDNAVLNQLLEQADEVVRFTEISHRLNEARYVCGLHSLAFALRVGERNVILLDVSSLDGLERLMKKLPHYGKYSYTVFNSTNGKNIAKGQWEVYNSPMLRVLD